MAIATKAQLRTALGGADGLLHRTYTDAKLDEFITMGEARLNRVLRLLDMIQTATGSLSTSVATLALPTRFLEKVSFRIDDPLTELQYVPPHRIKGYIGDLTTSRQPKRFTVKGSNFEFDAKPDSAYAYTLDYYRAYQLSADADTNYVLTYFPQAYMYASAIDAFLLQRKPEMAQAMQSMLRVEIAQIKAAERTRKAQGEAVLETEFNQRDRWSIDQG